MYDNWVGPAPRANAKPHRGPAADMGNICCPEANTKYTKLAPDTPPRDPDGVVVRREIRSMSAAEQQRYVSALRTMMGGQLWVGRGPCGVPSVCVRDCVRTMTTHWACVRTIRMHVGCV